MESKKINQLATELAPELSDLTIIGDPTTGISKKITLSQMASLFTGTVEEYANLASFPLVGTADTIYIALDTNIIYRWNTGTSAYVELSPNIVTSLVFNDANGFDGTISLVGSTATLTITTALTQGSIGFIGASGALTQDNSNFFWDNTNKRFGINTNAPTTAIDAFGSGIIGRLNGTSTNNAFLGFASAGSNKWSIGNVQSDHRFRIYSEANAAELVSVLQTGEVGIGIANPLTKLHIFGGASALIANLDANTSVAKSISFRSGNSSRINLEVSGTESGSNAGANLFIRTYTDAGSLLATPLTITRSTGAITLAGALSGTSAIFTGSFGIGATPYASTTAIIRAISSTSTNYALIIEDNATNQLFAIRNNGSAIFNSNLVSIIGNGLTEFKINNNTSEWELYMPSGGTDLRFYRGSDKVTLLANGNVGIGTTSPSFLLDISNAIDTYAQMRTSAIDADVFLGFSNTGDANNGWSIGRRNTGEFWISNYTGNFTSGTRTQPFVINTSGNTIISSVSSGFPLEVYKDTTSYTTLNVRNPNTTSGSGASIRLYSSGYDNMPAEIINKPDANGGTLLFNIRRADGTYNDFVTFRGDGNIRFNSTMYSNTTGGTIRTVYIGNSDYFLGGISSIRKSKKNIQEFTSEWIYDLKPVQFNYRKKDEEGNYTEEIYEEINYGLIAEDTAPIADFLINYNDKKDGTKEMVGIEYPRLITPMLKEIQELKKEIEFLKAK